MWKPPTRDWSSEAGRTCCRKRARHDACFLCWECSGDFSTNFRQLVAIQLTHHTVGKTSTRAFTCNIAVTRDGKMTWLCKWIRKRAVSWSSRYRALGVPVIMLAVRVRVVLTRKHDVCFLPAPGGAHGFLGQELSICPALPPCAMLPLAARRRNLIPGSSRWAGRRLTNRRRRCSGLPLLADPGRQRVRAFCVAPAENALSQIWAPSSAACEQQRRGERH